MSNQNSVEYKTAMEALDSLARRHHLSPSDTERKLFWQGVLHGLKRGRERSVGQTCTPAKPMRQKLSDVAGVHDSHVDSDVGLPKRNPDVNQGGVFRL